MTKAELIKHIAEKTGTNQSTVNGVLVAFKETRQEELKQNRSFS